MISAPSVMRCRSMPAAYMTENTIASTSGTDSATTMPVRQPSERKLTISTMPSASTKVSTNSETDCSTIVRLIGDLRHLDADRQLGDRSRPSLRRGSRRG